MRKNLFGEIIIEASDYAKKVVKVFTQQDGIRFAPNPDKVRGFYYWNDTTFPKFHGQSEIIYCIYKDGLPVYVGCSRQQSGNGLYARVSRFCCQLTGRTETGGEHPGAKKYKRFFKEDYSNLYVKYYSLCDNNKYNILLEEVEQEVIRILMPICNNEIYKNSWTASARLELK